MRSVARHCSRRAFAARLLGGTVAVAATWGYLLRDEARATPPRRHSSGRHSSGRRIDLELQDADIHDVLELFAEIGKVSIVTERGIPHKKVTARLVDVPWDEALAGILRSVGLGMLREGNVIYVVATDR
jgi:type IV pilus assembly protein PilQ